jgi:carboxyl-terminal processing protease
MLLTIMLVVGAVMGKSEETAAGAYRPLAVYTEVLAKIKSDYVEEPDIERVTQGALQGLVEYLDPLSSYLSPEQYKEYLGRQDFPDGGSGLSTGLSVHKRGNYTAVLNVRKDSSADRAGIEPGDLVEAIDDVSTRMMPPALLYAKLSGKTGEAVRLLVRPSRQYDDPVEYSVTREEVPSPKVETKMLDQGRGYLSVDRITADSIARVAAAVRTLEGQGAEALILDLRGNALGDPTLGAKLADLFLSQGALSIVKGQKTPERRVEASAETTVTELPVAVIVDRPSSGAAEVAAAALLDNDRATVVGERTYGLAAERETIEFPDGAALILSTAKYYRADGESLHDKGLDPSHPVSGEALRAFRDREDPTPVEQREDPFIKRAGEALDGAAPATAEEEKAAA